MVKTRSMTRNLNLDDASDTKRFKTFDNGYSTAPWSDLHHHVLFLVMMRLRVIDFVSFSGVCKLWRSLALSNRNTFMASSPPMSMTIVYRAYKQKCYLEDFEGRKFKTLLPHSAARYCVGLTSGYIILLHCKNYDYWLVNTITRHELYFPSRPYPTSSDPASLRAVLVFSPSISGWVFVTSHRRTKEIWFLVAGQGAWNCVNSHLPILDLHVFKGKIYTLHSILAEEQLVCELSFNPEPIYKLLKTKNLPNDQCLSQEFVSSNENLYVVHSISEQECKVNELDVGEMKWVSHEKTTANYSVFLSRMKSSAAVEQLSCADPNWSRRFADALPSGKVRLFKAYLWYFLNDCFNANRLEM